MSNVFVVYAKTRLARPVFSIGRRRRIRVRHIHTYGKSWPILFPIGVKHRHTK